MKNREKITEVLCEYWADAMDINDLIEYFKDGQREFLSKMDDKEITELMKDLPDYLKEELE